MDGAPVGGQAGVTTGVPRAPTPMGTDRMVKGLLLGSVSAAVLCVTLLGGASLLVPLSPQIADAPTPTARPAAPVAPERDESSVTRPAPLPGRPTPSAEPATATAAAPTEAPTDPAPSTAVAAAAEAETDVAATAIPAPAADTARVAQVPDSEGVAPAASVSEADAPERDVATAGDTANDTVGVVLPADSVFNRPPEDTDPVAPAPQDQPRLAEAAAPIGGTIQPAAAPRPDTTSAARPEADIVVAAINPPAAEASPTRPATVEPRVPRTFGEAAPASGGPVVGDAPARAPAVATVETQPADAESTAEVAIVSAAETAPQPGPSAEPEIVAVAPSAPAAPDASEVEPAADVQVAAVEADDPPRRTFTVPITQPDEIESAQATVGAAPRRIVLDGQSDDAPATTAKTLTVGAGSGFGQRDDAAEAEADTGAAETAPVAAPVAPSSMLAANAAPFGNPDGLPLFSVVLIDDPDGGVTRDNLVSFDFPVTFAIDPARQDADEAAAAYREAGHEVVMLAGPLLVGGTPQETEIALAGAVDAMPQAVGLIDATGDVLASGASILPALLPALDERGLGLVVRGGGLNSTAQRAQSAGVPTASIYRRLDEAGERATVITRYLDRATFEAAQQGAAVVIGRSTPEMVTALYSWSLGRRSNSVAIAPLSAVLRASDG